MTRLALALRLLKVARRSRTATGAVTEQGARLLAGEALSPGYAVGAVGWTGQAVRTGGVLASGTGGAPFRGGLGFAHVLFTFGAWGSFAACGAIVCAFLTTFLIKETPLATSNTRLILR